MRMAVPRNSRGEKVREWFASSQEGFGSKVLFRRMRQRVVVTICEESLTSVSYLSKMARMVPFRSSGMGRLSSRRRVRAVGEAWRMGIVLEVAGRLMIRVEAKPPRSTSWIMAKIVRMRRKPEARACLERLTISS